MMSPPGGEMFFEVVADPEREFLDSNADALSEYPAALSEYPAPVPTRRCHVAQH